MDLLLLVTLRFSEPEKGGVSLALGERCIHDTPPEKCFYWHCGPRAWA